MAKIKKYQWGTFSASGDIPQMVNPGNEALQQYTTTSSSSIPTGALPTSGNISQVAYNTTSKVKPKGMGFKGFMGKYGGAISSAASALAPLLMKKPDPNERPYKKGTNLIKYQEGVDNLENKTRFQNFMSGDIRRTSTGNLIGTLPTSYNEAKVPLAETKLEGRKPIITLQNYKENKGGYARALKSGIKDKFGNLVDPKTGYIYRNLNAVKSKPSAISTKVIPTTKVEKSTTTQKKEAVKVDKKRVYPEESPLARYKREGIPSKPATNIPTKVMDYKAQNLSTSRKAELAKNLTNYGMISPFNPSGSSNMYTPFFEAIHNTRFKKK